MRRTFIMFLALIASIEQTAYFGWNMTPQSDAEIICDLICILIFALAYV